MRPRGPGFGIIRISLYLLVFYRLRTRPAMRISIGIAMHLYPATV